MKACPTSNNNVFEINFFTVYLYVEIRGDFMENKFNWIAFLLAILVIAMFTGAAISIAEANLLMMGVFIFLGMIIMGFGIYRKTIRNRT